MGTQLSIVDRSVVIEVGRHAGHCGIVTGESPTGRTVDVMLTDTANAVRVSVRRSSVDVYS